ncbi:hypothetical protein [Flavisolibacter ginsenosidimutans]|uniref:DUF3316 domain-containing protein n=1 Tax=Flavisolibacter ginsenosidimutans TaxID=661481 RepID=A0A5B8UNJ9_9BACT|nr:hypothetical protein [Flavisolibacter ginsenosidimutans]QEC58143.1 hypothetical protein FSB75_20280 [Flavisolibacter ginsenosidimutans]
MKKIFFSLCVWLCISAKAQELYPYAEPASNMPSHSISLKNTSIFQRDDYSNRNVQRHMPELMFGLNKDWMLHLSTTVSNMHQQQMIWEGARLYAKYRFLANDDVHEHFRMATFAAAAFSRNHLDHNEINISMGDQSGVQAGLIATQLWNRIALSATGSWNEVLNDERWNKMYPDKYAVHAVNYSLSAGYLLLPFEYKDYNQTNVNLYAELLGSRNIAFREKYYVDFAPSVQAIFNSTAKLNLGYRFQLSSDIDRLAKNSWMISFEYIFLNALKKKH